MAATQNAGPAAGPGQSAPGPLPGMGGAAFDGVAEELHPLLNWIVDHFKMIAMILVGLIIIGVVVFIYDYNKERSYLQTREELGMILVSESGADRVKALQDFLTDAPGEFATQAQLELILALEEAGDYEQVLAMWEGLESADENLSVVAAMGRSSALSELGRHSEALTALVGIREQAPEAYRVPIARAIAAQAEAAQEWEEAISAYEALIDVGMEGDGGSFYQGRIATLRERLENGG